MALMPVTQAQARLLALASPLPEEQVPLDQAVGRWLARDIMALRDQPWTDLSSMDGYAVRSADGSGPWRVAGESAAGGAMPPPIGAGTAMRIFTGAPMPPGADCIVLQEDVTRSGDIATLTGDALIAPWRHVRRAGHDFGSGDVLLRAGERISPPAAALAALGGHGMVLVRRLPRIALVSSGDELVPPGAPVPPGKLPSSNAVMLRALLGGIPCIFEDGGIVGDDLGALTDAFARTAGADVIVTTGGASVGDHDLVRPAFEAAGGRLDFWKIAMKPGKPLIAGTRGASVFVGLPGNPVSAFVTATLFLLPLIRHLSGATDPLPATESATLGAPMPPVTQRNDYARGYRKDGLVHPCASQDSAGMRMLAAADCLILRPADSAPASVGDRATIIPFHPA